LCGASAFTQTGGKKSETGEGPEDFLHKADSFFEVGNQPRVFPTAQF
jgi:hypothetical protein